MIVSIFLLSALMHPARGIPSSRFQFFGELASFLSALFAAWIMSRIERRQMGVYGLPLRDAFGKEFWLGCAFGLCEILALIGRGHQDQILMSHDIAYKSSLTKYGGYGYHHLLVNVVPRLRRKGVDDAGLRRLLVENPARAFVFA